MSNFLYDSVKMCEGAKHFLFFLQVQARKKLQSAHDMHMLALIFNTLCLQFTITRYHSFVQQQKQLGARDISIYIIIPRFLPEICNFASEI
jgi:hypothetical protein